MSQFTENSSSESPEIRLIPCAVFNDGRIMTLNEHLYTLNQRHTMQPIAEEDLNAIAANDVAYATSEAELRRMVRRNQNIQEQGSNASHVTSFDIPEPNVDGAIPDILEGVKFVLTGIFPEFGEGQGLDIGKEQVKTMIKSFGGVVTSKVSGKTDVVVVGNKPGIMKLTKGMTKKTRFVDLRNLILVIKGMPIDEAPLPVIGDFSEGYKTDMRSAIRWNAENDAMSATIQRESTAELPLPVSPLRMEDPTDDVITDLESIAKSLSESGSVAVTTVTAQTMNDTTDYARKCLVCWVDNDADRELQSKIAWLDCNQCRDKPPVCHTSCSVTLINKRVHEDMFGHGQLENMRSGENMKCPNCRGIIMNLILHDGTKISVYEASGATIEWRNAEDIENRNTMTEEEHERQVYQRSMSSLSFEEWRDETTRQMLLQAELFRTQLEQEQQEHDSEMRRQAIEALQKAREARDHERLARRQEQEQRRQQALAEETDDALEAAMAMSPNIAIAGNAARRVSRNDDTAELTEALARSRIEH